VSAARSCERAASLAALISRFPTERIVRVVPDEERAYNAIRPAALVLPFDIRGGIVDRMTPARARCRAWAARVWLARRLARLSIHPGLAATWRGTAREDLYAWQRARAILQHVSTHAQVAR
jgi:hypothetical protein